MALTLFSVVNGLEDLSHFQVSDIPALEGLLGVITLFGGFLVYYGCQRAAVSGQEDCASGRLFAALSYGGWMWSEVIYDQQLISSYAVMERNPSPAIPK